MIQLTRNSPTNAYIAQKTVLRENRVMRNRVMRGLGVCKRKLPMYRCVAEQTFYNLVHVKSCYWP